MNMYSMFQVKGGQRICLPNIKRSMVINGVLKLFNFCDELLVGGWRGSARDSAGLAVQLARAKGC